MTRSILLTILVLLTPLASAQDDSSANQTAAFDRAPFAAFLEVMAPAWHTAWPARDFAALIAAGPTFTEQFKAIELMDPEQIPPARRPAFIKQRREFAAFVERYADACQRSDSELVYLLMPDLHNAFEATAATLLQMSYPEFEELMVTLDLIVQTHLPGRDIEGLVGSTETLRTKMETLITAPLPNALTPIEEHIRPTLETLRHLVLHMLQAMYQNDIKMYIIYTTELKTQTDEFISLNL